MTTGEMFFAVVFGVFGGFLGAVVAMSTMLRMDWPNPLDFEFRSEREKKRKMVVWVGAIWGFVIFSLLALLVNPADAQGILNVDVDAKGAAKEVGQWDDIHVAIVVAGFCFIALVCAVAWVIAEKNKLTMERRAPATNGNGHGHGRDELQKQITEIAVKMSGLPTRDDLQRMEDRLTTSLEKHDAKNENDFGEVKRRLESLENRQPGDSQK